MLRFQFVSGFGTATGSWSTLSILLPFSTPVGDWLVAGSSATGTLHLLSLGAGTATLISSQSLLDPSGTYMLEDAALVTLGGQMQLYSASRTGGWIDVQNIAPLAGGFEAQAPILQVGGVTMAVSVVETLHLENGTFLATATHDRGTLEILRLSADAAPRLVDRVTASPKAMLDGVSDMVSLTRGSDLFLIAASGRRDGLSSFRVEADGRLELSDSLTAKDGLWVSSLDALAVTEVGGAGYVIAGSATAGSLSVIRVNPLGVMFVTDQFLDDRTTRFDTVSRIETITNQGRSFVVAAGGDGGISLLELLPGGKLMHHQSLEARDGWAGFASGVSGLSVRMTGDALDIFVAGAGGLSRFSVAMEGLGPLIMGTAGADRLTGGDADELIFGAGGNDTLIGEAGDDILVAGTLGSVLTGGAGDDIFRLKPGPQYSRITDFEQGHDRIDLSEWGRIYDISALTITARSYGAQISFGDLTLRVSQPGGGSIPLADWGADDFLF
ncbi:MAG: hypothetical protein K9G72_20465 [Rhodobacteraceae bacterium]|nr:hypothetical protein [Paracoccaceae bacterium]MCF8521021.1 hypothetical protein [Paracoccaceae bacterium]